MAAHVNPRLIALPLAALSLAACASPSRYPSLAVRDAERATGTAQPAEPEPYVPPATPPEVVDRIDRLTAAAQAAHQAFLAAAERAQGPIEAARGAAEGSDRWSAAQVALAEVETSRGQTMIPLADLDRLYVDAELDAADATRIAAARDEVGGLIDNESRRLSEMRASMGS